MKAKQRKINLSKTLLFKIKTKEIKENQQIMLYQTWGGKGENWTVPTLRKE